MITLLLNWPGILVHLCDKAYTIKLGWEKTGLLGGYQKTNKELYIVIVHSYTQVPVLLPWDQIKRSGFSSNLS